MKKILGGLALGAFVLALLGCVQNPAAIQGLPAHAAARPNRRAVLKPAEVIAAYYAALDAHDMVKTLDLLPDDVVLAMRQPDDKGGYKTVAYKGILEVQHFIEGDSTVFSRKIEQVTVQGDTVEYILTEWLNPRTTGMNLSQPVTTRYTAVVRDGLIQSLTQESGWNEAAR